MPDSLEVTFTTFLLSINALRFQVGGWHLCIFLTVVLVVQATHNRGGRLFKKNNNKIKIHHPLLCM